VHLEATFFFCPILICTGKRGRQGHFVQAMWIGDSYFKKQRLVFRGTGMWSANIRAKLSGQLLNRGRLTVSIAHVLEKFRTLAVWCASSCVLSGAEDRVEVSSGCSCKVSSEASFGRKRHLSALISGARLRCFLRDSIINLASHHHAHHQCLIAFSIWYT
jgi:hypothetical protein